MSPQCVVLTEGVEEGVACVGNALRSVFVPHALTVFPLPPLPRVGASILSSAFLEVLLTWPVLCTHAESVAFLKGA